MKWKIRSNSWSFKEFGKDTSSLHSFREIFFFSKNFPFHQIIKNIYKRYATTSIYNLLNILLGSRGLMSNLLSLKWNRSTLFTYIHSRYVIGHERHKKIRIFALAFQFVGRVEFTTHQGNKNERYLISCAARVSAVNHNNGLAHRR